MTVWGHNEVYVEKDVSNRCWIVSTSKTRQHLVTIPWFMAFKDVNPTTHPDFCNALAACLSSPNTSLTREEALSASEEVFGVAPPPPVPRPVASTPSKKSEAEPPAQKSADRSNVLSMDAFRKKKRT